jgi:hypothetical protein
MQEKRDTAQKPKDSEQTDFGALVTSAEQQRLLNQVLGRPENESPSLNDN